jgi:hypothetical protein
MTITNPYKDCNDQIFIDRHHTRDDKDHYKNMSKHHSKKK